MQCLTCKITIENTFHYESDYHTFNLKRKLIELPILSYKEFDKIQLINKNKVKNEEEIFNCEFCGKYFKKVKRLENHIKSHFNDLNNEIITEDNKYNLNMNILTDGMNLFLENYKVLGSKKPVKFLKNSSENSKLVLKERIIPFESPKCIDKFIKIEKVNNKLDKAKYIVRRFD